jgi:hypothetical protein
MSADWAKRYWRAHWNLPSPMQGYEMLHRLRPNRSDVPFTDKDLDTLLRISDYPKFFRERLKAISYQPYTRVDVRRMYQAGVLNEQDVYEAYLDLGYDEEHARNLTQFTIRQETGDADTKSERYKELTVSQIKQGYVKGVVSKDEAIERLKALRYQDDEVRIILQIWDTEAFVTKTPSYKSEYVSDIKGIVEKAYLKRLIGAEEFKRYLSKIGYRGGDISLMLEVLNYAMALEDMDMQVDLVHDLYVSGTIEYDDTVIRLSKLNLPAGMQGYLLDRWTLELQKRTKHLTETQYRAAYTMGLVTADDYRKFLKDSGYTDKDIDLICAIYKIE